MLFFACFFYFPLPSLADGEEKKSTDLEGEVVAGTDVTDNAKNAPQWMGMARSPCQTPLTA